MVSFKLLFLAAATTISVFAQDASTEDDAAAALYWDEVATGQLVGGESPEKRDATIVKVPRTDAAVLKDPYKGSFCWAPYTTPPCETTCNRNNCFRGLLNARDGSPGKHCPSEAFGFCCAWNYAKDSYKYWGIKTGIVFHLAPYTLNCQGDSDNTQDVLDKLNDACGCTLNHEVTVDVTSDYYGLRRYRPHSSECS